MRRGGVAIEGRAVSCGQHGTTGRRGEGSAAATPTSARRDVRRRVHASPPTTRAKGKVRGGPLQGIGDAAQHLGRLGLI
jgi:hypothetical protein